MKELQRRALTAQTNIDPCHRRSGICRDDSIDLQVQTIRRAAGTVPKPLWAALNDFHFSAHIHWNHLPTWTGIRTSQRQLGLLRPDSNEIATKLGCQPEKEWLLQEW